jgi:hypothetical protein
MIYFSFGEPEEYKILFPSSIHFRNLFDNSYLNIPDVRYVLKAVDNNIIKDGAIYSLFFDEFIDSERLSGGCKTVLLPILLKDYTKEKWMISSYNLGDNCAIPLCSISKHYNVYLSIVTPLYIPEYCFEIHDFYNIDYNEPVKSIEDYRRLSMRYNADNPKVVPDFL